MSTLRLEDVCVKFETAVGPVRALDGIDVTVADGEFVTVIGANGAGKSTLVNVVAGSLQPTSGSIRLDDRDLCGMAEHRRAREIARVYQDTTASLCGELSVQENLMLALTRRRRRSPLRLARSKRRTAVGAEALDVYGSGLSKRMKQPAGLMSGGQRQLVALAMAVLARPSVLLLDEHTSALDHKMAETVMEATDDVVRRERLTTLMITHNLAFAARYGGRLLIMSDGRVVDELSASAPERRDEQALIDRFRSSVVGAVSDSMLA